MTTRLFDRDSYIKTFKSKVLTAVKTECSTQIVLNQTAFFPEEGGQSSDTGTLNGMNVLLVKEKDGEIIHTVDGVLKEGDDVVGCICWKDRFDKMQQHTGEHIVSGLILKFHEYNNVGFHLGDDVSTLDFDGAITHEELAQIEDLANEAIYNNLSTEVLYPTQEELKTLNYRSKIEIKNQVRLVHIPGYDICACCAPHVRMTGEIGMIKFVGIKNYKGGVRISMLCGKRALSDYRYKANQIKQISVLLSAKEYQANLGVERLLNEKEQLKSDLITLKNKLLEDKANELIRKHQNQDQALCLFSEDLDESEARALINLLLARNIKTCGIFLKTDETQYKYVIGSIWLNMREFGKAFHQIFPGKGGGTTQMIQGMINGKEEHIRMYLEKNNKDEQREYNEK